MLFGYPVIPNARMESGGAANNVSALFGNFEDGIVCGERSDLMVTNNPYTNPGKVTWYGLSRFKAVVRDTGAIVGLRSSAS